MIECLVSTFMEKVRNYIENHSGDLSKELIQQAFHSVYTDLILELLDYPDIHIISNGRFHSLSRHSHYSRPLLFMDHRISVDITRVRCDDGSTHAVLLSFMIPYSSRTVCDYISAITDEESEINASSVHFERSFLKWLFHRFLSLHKSLRDFSVYHLSSHCLKEMNLQFMQFKSVPVFSFGY